MLETMEALHRIVSEVVCAYQVRRNSVIRRASSFFESFAVCLFDSNSHMMYLSKSPTNMSFSREFRQQLS